MNSGSMEFRLAGGWCSLEPSLLEKGMRTALGPAAFNFSNLFDESFL